MPVARPDEGLFEHPWADLHAEGNNVVDRETSALRMFATSFAGGCLKLTERVLTIDCKMASNPLNSGHFITDGYHFASDLVELVRGERREGSRDNVPGHGDSVSERGTFERVS